MKEAGWTGDRENTFSKLLQKMMGNSSVKYKVD